MDCSDWSDVEFDRFVDLEGDLDRKRDPKRDPNRDCNSFLKPAVEKAPQRELEDSSVHMGIAFLTLSDNVQLPFLLQVISSQWEVFADLCD